MPGAVCIEVRRSKRLRSQKKCDQYIRHLRGIASGQTINTDELDLSQERALLAREQTRRLERENDLEEKNLITSEQVIELLQFVSKQAATIFDNVPANIKRRVPHLKAKDVNYIRTEIAKARNKFADIRFGDH